MQRLIAGRRYAALSLSIFVSVLVAVLSAPATCAQDSTDGDFATAVDALKVKSFKKKAEALDSLARIEHSRTLEVLQAMLQARLYYRKQDGRVVIVKGSGREPPVHDALTGQDLGKITKTKLKKIAVNNKLRTKLRGLLARLRLASDDAGVRLAAVEAMTGRLRPEAADVLRRALEQETHPGVVEAIHTALAFVNLDHPDKQARMNAIGALAGSLSPRVRSRLASLVQQNADGSYQEADADVRAAAARALQGIDVKRKLYALVETSFFGLSLGSVLLLAAIGLAITFGVMGVINMAHGELIMLGAYTTYVVQSLMPEYIDLSLIVAVPAAFLVAGLAGVGIERSVIRFLYGRPLETLLATFGISLILQQLVRTIFSPLNRSVATPSWMSGSLEINTVLSLTYNRLYIVLFALLVFAALLLILKATRLGLQIRAVTQNRSMAKAMGIRTGWVDAMTFGLGSGIAGVAGVALSQLTNVGPNLGQSYIIDSFMVVVFGGVGNLWGTLVGALTLGVANKFLEPYSGAVLAKILILVLIIAFIQKRPRGLFPQKGRAAEG